MGKIDRKDFLKKISLVTLGFTSFSKLIASKKILDKVLINENLIKDPNGILDLPKGFSYQIISKYKDKMNDSLKVPDHADGMTCFKGSGNNIILIRNHELGHFPILERTFKTSNPFGKNLSKFIKKNKNKFYDIRDEKVECFGCTTTIVYDAKKEKVVNQYLSLAGTLVNCSGGPTPWGTWISCEETVRRKSGKIAKDHGYNFEVYPSEKIHLSNPIPLKAMGRFRHEAVAIDPTNKLVYQTEDRDDGLFYRFIPNVYKKLSSGGQLQALSIVGFRGKDCTNWKNSSFKIGEKFKVKWIDLDNVESPDDDLRIRGRNRGCSFFARGEGLWYADDFVYFTSTTGGKERLGQIWRYQHRPDINSEGIIELFFESRSKDVLNMPDNIIVSPWGNLIASEDGKGPDRLVKINAQGECLPIAKNALNNSEFAGTTFSPDNKILFVNIYSPTMTIAIRGPWESLIDY
mgnify:CR=1 FL=1